MAKRDRAAAIRGAAGQLFAIQGVAATTVRQIGQEIDMVSGTLYYYFPSKESIASDIVSRFLVDLNAEYEDLLSLTSRSATEQLTSLVTTSFEVCIRHPYATEIYQNEASALSILPDHEDILANRDRAQVAWQKVIERGVTENEFRSDIDSYDFRHMLSELTWLNVRWHRAQLPELHHRLASDLISIFLDGFAARGTQQPQVLGSDS